MIRDAFGIRRAGQDRQNVDSLDEGRIRSRRQHRKTLLPEGAVSTIAQGIENGKLVERSTDPLGQLVTASDIRRGKVTVDYNLAGRRVALTSPDTGTVESDYDEAGNLLRRTDPVLRSHGKSVTYEYDAGSQIKTVSDDFRGQKTDYVKDIAYDAFGQRTYIEYGNGVRTAYTYDENRRWLDAIKTESAGGTVHQNMNYCLDLVGNVSGDRTWGTPR